MKMNKKNENINPEEDMPIIFKYTRREALEDGVLSMLK